MTSAARISRLEAMLPPDDANAQADRELLARIDLESDDQIDAALRAELTSPEAIAECERMAALTTAELDAAIAAEMAEPFPILNQRRRR